MPRKGPLSLIPPVAVISQRPEPPDDLSPAEAEVWRRLVAGMKPGWCNGAVLSTSGTTSWYPEARDRNICPVPKCPVREQAVQEIANAPAKPAPQPKKRVNHTRTTRRQAQSVKRLLRLM
jgi:hypothetical protein